MTDKFYIIEMFVFPLPVPPSPFWNKESYIPRIVSWSEEKGLAGLETRRVWNIKPDSDNFAVIFETEEECKEWMAKNYSQLEFGYLPSDQSRAARWARDRALDKVLAQEEEEKRINNN